MMQVNKKDFGSVLNGVLVCFFLLTLQFGGSYHRRLHIQFRIIVITANLCFQIFNIGLMSGLTLGLMSLSVVELEVLIKAGEPHERRNAEKILPLVKRQHLLLCTLLIGNALAMEALPIFVDALLPAWGAILISVTLVLTFGEILPQAVCSRYGLSIGAKLSCLVRLIIIILSPLAYPISKLLDWLLGTHHSTLLRRAELKTLVYMHGNEAGKGGELTHDETTIISGALDMTQKTAKDAMTPISETFSLDIDSKLDEKTMGLIASEGHSRVPMYSGDPKSIVGFILVKNLIKIHPEDKTPMKDLPIRRMPRVHENLPLYDILNIFQTGGSHMAAVVGAKNVINSPVDHKNVKGASYKLPHGDDHVILSMPVTHCSEVHCQSPTQYIDSHVNEGEEVIGIITLEDVMEELIQEEIFDETDRYVQVHKRITVNMLVPVKSPETSTRTSELGRRSPSQSPPISPYHQSNLSPNNIMMTPTLLRSPVRSPYRKSPLIRPTLFASPSRSSPAMCSDIDSCSSLSPRVARASYVKLPRPNAS